MIVFLDTNKIFPLYNIYVDHMGLPRSFLYAAKDSFTYIISDYVLYELETTCTKYEIPFTDELVHQFLSFMCIKVIGSRQLMLDEKYIYDIFDL